MPESTHTSQQIVFACPLASGLHARPASHLAELANQFTSECTLTNLRNGLVANAKSVLGIIAADIRHNDRCTLYVNGSDEPAAHAALRNFVQNDLPYCDVPLAQIPASNNGNAIPRLLLAAKVTCITGTPVSRGVARGKVVVLKKMALPAQAGMKPADDSRIELARMKDAIAAVRQRIGERLKYAVTPVGAAVLQADLAMAGDVFLVEKLTQQILAGKSAAQAVIEIGEFFIDLLGHSESEYIRQRSADIEEICLQLLEEVGATVAAAAVELTEPSVLVADTLAPQQMLQLDRRWLKALVLEHSGTASHAAILARSLGIPTLAGVRNARVVLTPGSEILVDADRGLLTPAITPAVRRFYEREQQTLERRNQERARDSDPAVTADGKMIEVGANAASADEVSIAFENGADGIGLFRTEMIFLGREEPPSEQEQTAIYSEAARNMAGRPVIIRTFDIGGDKKVPYLNLPQEENPFLGYRGMRLYAEHQELLQCQLRAILRASAAGSVRVMAPMISSLDEIESFKSALKQAKHSLRANRVDFADDLQVGIMIEVPSVAFLIEELCAHVDFFSLGTNDLSQYFFAADRGNPRVAAQFAVRHPAFLRFLGQIVTQIHRGGKWVGMCGEMAADTRNLPLLLGMALDEISVPAAELHDFKRAVAGWRVRDCAGLLERAVRCVKTGEVDALLAEQKHDAPLRPLLSDELVLLKSTAQTKEEVMQEMVDALYISGRANDRHSLEEALWAREAMGSTGLGYGFAIPHCKTDAAMANSICILRLQNPIDWDPDHQEPVRMIVLLALRDSDALNLHMQIFSSLARKLMNDDFRRHLLNLATASELRTYLGRELGISL